SVHFHVGTRVCQRLYKASSDESKSHCVYVHVVASPLFCERLRQTNDSRLARRVAGLPRISVGTRNGSDIYDFAHNTRRRGNLLLGRFPDKSGSGAEYAKWSHKVNIQHRLELLIGRLLDHVIPAITGVIDDDVDRIERRKRRLHDHFRNRRIGKISRYMAHPMRARQFRFRIQQHVLVEIVDHYSCAGVHKPFSDGSSDPAPRSGHERRLTFQRERAPRHRFRFSISPSKVHCLAPQSFRLAALQHNKCCIAQKGRCELSIICCFGNRNRLAARHSWPYMVPARHVYASVPLNKGPPETLRHRWKLASPNFFNTRLEPCETGRLCAMNNENHRDVVILSAIRTALGKFGGALKDCPPTEIAGEVVRESVKRSGLASPDIGNLVFGHVIHTDAKDM